MSKRERKKQNKLEKKREEEKSAKTSLVNKLLMVAGVVVLAIFAWNFLTSSESGDTPDVTQGVQGTRSELLTIQENDYVIGDPNSQVWVIEYADFQCPACAGYQPIMKELMNRYSDRVAFAHRHFPLRTTHRHAQISSQAAEAAGFQNKFWEMADMLYDKQDEWSVVRDPRGIFEEYAAGIGLDVEQFKNDMNSSEVKAIVDQSYANAAILGLNSTPTIIINDQVLPTPPRSVDEFSQLLDEALSQVVVEEESASPSAETDPSN